MKHMRAVELRAPDGWTTKLWAITTEDEQYTLGNVKWFNKWRKYTFFPEAGTVFDAFCLEELASFCKQATIEHKPQI